MADPINRVTGIRPGAVELERPVLRTTVPSSETKSFKEVLADTITEVQRLQTEADTAVKKMVSGEVKDVTEAMVAVEKADMAFRTMMNVRNKVVAAYEEIMRMQV